MKERDASVLHSGALSAARVFIRWLEDEKRFPKKPFTIGSDDEVELVQRLQQWASVRYNAGE